MRTRLVLLTMVLLVSTTTASSEQPDVNRGSTELSPSRSEYFSWINNTNEGATEAQTMVNLAFFRWLHDEYGFELDIYAFDAGAIDGKRFYGRVGSERFIEQFPNGFAPIAEAAAEMGTRLGVWGGPDGFGNTPQEEAARIEQMVALCRDLDFALFKFDAVCGPLRPEKEDAFIRMMTECRTHAPDLILLNHRLGLERAQAHATTFLWEGRETYTDVFSTNRVTAPHHRADALNRGLVPGMQRLTEDHGVCLSSGLNFWEDELVLQAFNRALILAPQIYGNPWLLRDDEFPRLARLFNLARKYRDLMVSGMALPEKSFGPAAVSRGDGTTRLITLRNPSWAPMAYEIPLDETIGLECPGSVQVRRFHPAERMLGDFDFGDTITVEVAPFRSHLLFASTAGCDEPGIEDADYEVVRNVPGKPVLIRTLATTPAPRRLADLIATEVPGDAETLYETTVFAADNNALEIRALERSGPSEIPEVQAARNAFFNQAVFRARGIWDRNLFDDDPATGFWPSRKYGVDQRVQGGCFRLDLGEVVDDARITLHTPDEYSLQPILLDEANWVEVSADLVNWRRLRYMSGLTMDFDLDGPARYLRFPVTADRFNEVTGEQNGIAMDRSRWRATNLFAHPSKMEPVAAWKATIRLDGAAPGDRLAIAIEGVHGVEGAYAAVKAGDRYIGAPNRAAAYPSNTWEYVNARRETGYTYFFPVSEDMVNRELDVWVLGFDEERTDLHPVAWLVSDPASAIGPVTALPPPLVTGGGSP